MIAGADQFLRYTLCLSGLLSNKYHSSVCTKISCYLWDEYKEAVAVFKESVCWLLNVPATCYCISGTDLLRQFCGAAHTEIEVADQTFHLTQSQYTDTGPTTPIADPVMPGTWQGIHWSATFEVTGMTRPGKIMWQAGFEPRIFCSRGGRLIH